MSIQLTGYIIISIQKETNETDFNGNNIREEKIMSIISGTTNNGIVNSEIVGATKTGITQKKNRVSKKTIGSPELSETAAKYYEKLKQKYSNMDFILVSKDQKEQVQAQAGRYADANRMVVLIDEEKIETMAVDENYRKQYEGIIANAANGLSQLRESFSGTGANVKTYGIKINDNGTASYFAVIDRSLTTQRSRIEKKAEEKKEAKRSAEKKARKEEREEQLEKSRGKKSSEKEDHIMITASSIDELISKINDIIYMDKSNNVETEKEKSVGQNINVSV